MTSLIAWLGVDSRGSSSFYLASDSRITWTTSGGSWDSGQKLFCGIEYPDLFGYAGDVLFPFIFLSQATRLLSVRDGAGALLDPQARHEAFRQMAAEALDLYPPERRNPFSLLHCAREHYGMASQFHLWRMTWSPQAGWADATVEMPSKSSLVVALGSGETAVISEDRRWQATAIGGTSRAVFGSFCDALNSNQDPKSGGSPQLVGLYRKGNGKHFGIVYREQRFVSGLPVGPKAAALIEIEWRNHLFERCDPNSMSPASGAQRHARPTELVR